MKYISTLFVILLLTAVTPLPGQPDSQNQTVTILEYGFPRANDYRNAQSTVAERWGIEFKSVAGCMVTEHLIDSVKQHNELAHAQIVEKFGQEWRELFDQEVEVELSIQLSIRELIDSQVYIHNLDSTLRTEGNGLLYLLTPVNSEEVYSAIVCGWGNWNGKRELLQYYRLLINQRIGSVEIENDVVELFTIE